MPGRWRQRWPAACIVVVLLALPGCSPGTTPPPSSGPATAVPTAASTPSSTTASSPGPSASGLTVTAEDLRRVLAFAGGTTEPADSDLGKLWAQAFVELDVDGQRPYAPPSRVVGYRAGELPDTRCAAPGTEALFRNDARYCPADGSIAYDEDWLLTMSSRLGYAGPLTILAHEWGHHVQSIVGMPKLDIAQELQADCLSGLYATASGLYPHEGDRELELVAMEAGLRTWSELADEEYAESTWFDPGTHGSMQQRMMAFTTGAQSNVELSNAGPAIAGGVPWCDGYREFVAKDYAKIGEYQLLNIPGRRGTSSGDAYAIPAETRTSRPTSAVVLAWIAHLPLAGGATDEQLQALWKLGYPNISALAPVPMTGSISSGTGAAWYYENRSTIDGVEHVESGVFALLAPEATDGGLLVIVSRPTAARTGASAEDLDVLEEHLSTLYQVLGRLCTPDETADMAGAHPDVVCMTDVQ